MSNRVKRVLAGLMASAVLISLAAGCSGSTDASSAQPDSAPASGDTAAESSSDAETPAASGEVTNLEFWHIQTTEPMPTIIQGSIDRYMEANPQYNVEVVITANDAFKQKLTVAMGSGQTPDIYHSWSGGPMIEYIKSGHMQDITEQMNRDGFKDKFLEAAISQATYDGKIWGVPVENVAIATIWYNKEMFAQYGLEVPTTIEELETVCDTLIANGKTPFSLANKTQWTGSMYFMNLATRYGGLEPFQKAVSGEGSFEDESFVYAGEKIQEWVGKGYFNAGFNGADEDSGQSRQLLYTEEAAMSIMGSWFAYQVKGENAEFYEKVGVFNFPAMTSSSADPNIVIGTVGDNFYHVSGTCQDVDGAFGAIAYLLDDQAVADRIGAGKIPPLKDITLEDPLLQEVMNLVNKAPEVQLWYDQYLPPEVSDVHKTTSQEIFGNTMTPQEANQKMQEAMAAYNAKQ